MLSQRAELDQPSQTRALELTPTHMALLCCGWESGQGACPNGEGA